MLDILDNATLIMLHIKLCERNLTSYVNSEQINTSCQKLKGFIDLSGSCWLRNPMTNLSNSDQDQSMKSYLQNFYKSGYVVTLDW